MGIIWLIIKIILWTLFAGVSCIIFLCMLVLLAPIRYEAYLEKYDGLNYEVKLRYLMGIRGHFYLQDGIQSGEVKVFGKRVYSSKEEEKGIEEKIDVWEAKTIQSGADNGQERVKDAPDRKATNRQGRDLKKQQVPIRKSSLIDEHKTVEQTVTSSSIIREEEENERDFKPDKGGITKSIKEVMAIPQFAEILKSTFKLIKELIIYIGPKEWSFELIIGREDPADTGELMAKLIMLYPWYYQHGVIEGNYEAAGIWGGFLAEGKFCIGGIIRRIIVFLWYRPVRESIKLILSQRKEEKDGK